MSLPSDNENWIIDVGDTVIEKKANSGISSLTEMERLIHCLWVADYGMRNAGDLDTAQDLYAGFQDEAAQIADELSLVFTRESFKLPKELLQIEYFERFDQICSEIIKEGERN